MKIQKFNLFLSLFFKYYLDQAGPSPVSAIDQVSLYSKKGGLSLGGGRGTLQNFIVCCSVISKISKAGGEVLFVGQRRGFKKIFRLGSLVLPCRGLLGKWPAGFLSNWGCIQKLGTVRRSKPSLLVAFDLKNSLLALREASQSQVPAVCGVGGGVTGRSGLDFYFYTNVRNDRSFFFFSFILLSIVHDENLT